MTLSAFWTTHEGNPEEEPCRLARKAAREQRPKSERLQISHHPGSPSNKESQGAFGPVEMRFWVSDQVRNPNQDAKECQHERHQTHRKSCLAIDENGNPRECKRDRRKDRPKHLAGWNPLWNQVSCLTKKEHLTQRKGNRTDAESKARQSAEHYRPGGIRLSRSVQRDCAAEQGNEQEEAPAVFVIDVCCGNDVRDAGQRETQIHNAKYDRSRARSARMQHPNPTSNLSGHETLADDGAKGQAPDVLQVLPGVRVVPHQGDDPEQHRRRAQDDPPVQCRLHTAKLTEMSGASSGNGNL